MKDIYFDTAMLFERLHRLFLEVLRAELDRCHVKDLNNVQAIVLYNIGKNQLTVGEISNRGYYLGSNVSYNLKKMVDSGYLVQEPSSHDKRSIHIKLSAKGLKVLDKLESALNRHTETLKMNNVQEQDLKNMVTQGHTLEAFWSHMLAHELRF